MHVDFLIPIILFVLHDVSKIGLSAGNYTRALHYLLSDSITRVQCINVYVKESFSSINKKMSVECPSAV